MNFNVYKQNVGKGDATDPKIISDGIREFDTWIQQCSSNTGGGNSTSGSNNATGLAGTNVLQGNLHIMTDRVIADIGSKKNPASWSSLYLFITQIPSTLCVSSTLS